MKEKERPEEYNERIWKEIQQEFDNHKDEFILEHFRVAKFIGVENVPDDDFFYKLQYWGNFIESPSVCACKIIPLKGLLSDKEYKNLEYSWNLNKEFWPEKQPTIFLNGDGKYIKIDENGVFLTLN